MRLPRPWRRVLRFANFAGLLSAAVAAAALPAVLAERCGYTWSLLIWLMPVLLFGWSHCRREQGIWNTRPARRALACAAALTVVYATVAETCLAQYAFWFPNRAAVVGLQLPHFNLDSLGFDAVRTYPFEELLFYLIGPLAILFTYVWADGESRDPAARSGTVVDGRSIRGFLVWAGGSLVLCAAIWGATIAARNELMKPPPTGLPVHSGLILILGVAPTLSLYYVVQRTINWTAASFTLLVIVPLSAFYEAALGLPRGWWGYQSQAAIGICLDHERRLPLEAVMVWVESVFFMVFLLEAFREWRERAVN